MAGYYPLMLDLRGKTCIVVGGGPVAERKIRSLLDADAEDVRVISPTVTKGIAELARSGSIQLRLGEYLEQDIDGARLVFAATGDPDLNRCVAAAAVVRGALTNVADDSAYGDFVTPSVIRRGDLVMAVTTGGASPALASGIGRDFMARYGPDYAGKVERLRELREHVRLRLADPDERRDLLRLAAEEALAGSLDELTGSSDADRMDEWIRRLRAAADRRQT
ncbi:precorrin-2 dehydrogenase/sirohydrochlorin ferrochelatase family protein [Paenibacillus spongiae]|uniref:precorrin-2 dehydrogenase n=1 Tax=Paenibacillus spongiae TaxID=2909671 RepID=A0ABY5S3T1_9BACL|nr:bifunctional precorrin-2 dehydrogenase/sirohydrochlorin ferrochelatase [Paenibacillus spongiae]UVI28133.1 bifunctional precorrin-2 dehydrogenase/sirohydrochlorin ferrochelatase [Paenibacillus spongiae]